ncbi:11692_t:CDS:1, partial [Racocetra persica]
GGSAATNCSHKSYNPNNLGVKIFGSQLVKKGSIIVRQHGTKYKGGPGVFLGRDYTIHAQHDGIVKFYQKYIRRQKRTFVSVLPLVKAG